MTNSDSTKPTGATSFKQTSFGIIPRNELLRLELEGTKRGLNFVHELVKSNNSTEITPQFIQKLHSIAFAWIFPDWAGRFRTIQVTYSGKEAPPYFQLPELVKNFCEDLKTRFAHLPKNSDPNFIDSAIELITWFQHQFVFIHPFQDYNGRMARMLTSLLLLKLGLPVAEIKVESDSDRQKYLQAMQQGDESDLTLLERLITESLVKELEK